MRCVCMVSLAALQESKASGTRTGSIVNGDTGVVIGTRKLKQKIYDGLVGELNQTS